MMQCVLAHATAVNGTMSLPPGNTGVHQAYVWLRCTSGRLLFPSVWAGYEAAAAPLPQVESYILKQFDV